MHYTKYNNMPNKYCMPKAPTKVINKYHVECEKVEVPCHTHVIYHNIKKPVFVPKPVYTEETINHPFVVEEPNMSCNKRSEFKK